MASKGLNTSIYRGFWFAILASAFVQVRVQIGDSGPLVLISTFEFVVLLLTAMGLWKGWASWPPKRMTWLVGLLGLGIIAHSLFVSAQTVGTIPGTFSHIAQQTADTTSIVKETIKPLVLILLFTCLVALFQDDAAREVPVMIVFGVVAAFAVPVVLISIFEPIFIARTSQAVGLVCLVFLIAQDAIWMHSRRRRLFLIALSIAVFCVCIVLKSKATALTAFLFAIWFYVAPTFAQPAKRRATSLLLFIGTTMAAVFAVIALTGDSTEKFYRIDSVSQSLDVRLRIWEVTTTTLVENFPVGVGLGQLGVILTNADLLWNESHRFPHNSALGLLTELGFFGGAIIALLVWVIVRGLQYWPWPVRFLYLVLLGPALILQDGHSIRTIVLILALGYAGYLSKRTQPETE